MADVANLRVKIGADTAGLKKGLGGIGGMLGKMGGLMAAAFGVQKIVQFGTAVFNLRKEFDYTMSRVKALTGANDAMAASLDQLAQRMGRETQFTAKQAGDAMIFLAQAGQTVEEITASLPGTLQLAAAGAIDLASAADIATNVLSAYGMQAEELGRVNDVIISVTSSMNTNVMEFSEAFKMVGPIARTAGLEIEEVSTAIGVLGNNAIKGTMAGTNLRGILASISSPTKDAQETFDRLGISLRDSEGNVASLRSVFTQLSNAKPEVEDFYAMFERRNASAAAALTNNADQLTEFTDVVKNDMGIAAKIAGDQMDNLKGDVLKLTSVWEGFMLSLTEGKDGPLRAVVQAITKFISALGPMLNQAAQYLEQFINYWIELYNKSIVVKAVFEAIAFVIKTLWDLGKHFVTTFIDGLSSIGRIFETLMTKPGDLFKVVGEEAVKFAESMKEKGELIAENFKEGWNRVMDDDAKLEMVSIPPVVIQAAADQAVTDVEEKFAPVGEKMIEVVAGIQEKGLDAELMAAISEEIDTMVDNQIALVNAGDAVAANQKKIAGAVQSGMTSASGSIKDFGKNALQTVKKVIQGFIAEGIAGLVAKTMATWPAPLGLALGAAAGVAGAALLNTIIPSFATGGMVSGPTLAMVGDNPNASRDPEVMMPMSKLSSAISDNAGGGGISGRLIWDGRDVIAMLDDLDILRNNTT